MRCRPGTRRRCAATHRLTVSPPPARPIRSPAGAATNCATSSASPLSRSTPIRCRRYPVCRPGNPGRRGSPSGASSSSCRRCSVAAGKERRNECALSPRPDHSTGRRRDARWAGPGLAGAGTGKTRTLTAAVAHRIAVRRVDPARILAVTFTNKAAGEMAARIRAALGESAAPSWIGTFHGVGARQLRIEPEIAALRPGFDILDADDSRRVVKRVMKAMNLADGGDVATVGRDPVKLMCNRLATFKDGLITPEDASARVEAMIAAADRTGTPVDPQHLRASARVYAEYQRTLRDANVADFGDLLLWPTRALQTNGDYRGRWAGRFDAVLADEYQDVNHAQCTWLRMLANRHCEVFVVGDDDQSIYSWRGADVHYIRNFTRDFPDAAQVRLEENFRSTGHILDAANAVIARDRGRLGKTLYIRKQAGDRIEIVAFTDAEAEAAGVVA